MQLGYKISSLIYQALNGNAPLKAIVSGIYPTTQKPIRAANPCITLFIPTEIESVKVGVLSDAILTVVARSNYADGDGSELQRIYDAVDVILKDNHFQSTEVSGTLRASGQSVSYGLWDEESRDFFKMWKYRVKLKKRS